MRIGILGPLEVHDEAGTLVELAGARMRALLARLALSPGTTVPAQTLIDALWGEQPPAGGANALQALVSRLRRALPDGSVASEPGGYRLMVPRRAVDAYEFERLAAAGRSAVDDDVQWAVQQFEAALALWRGPALTDVADLTFAHSHQARLDEARLAAIEDLAEARLRIGNGRPDIAGLEAVVSEHPTRERAARILMQTLAADGRPADALAVYERVRSTLADALGTDPSPELTGLHVGLLRGEMPDGVPGRHNGRAASNGEPADSAGGAPPTNLRSNVTSFIGRDDDVARVSKLVGESRLTTLTGPGGSGKTRLAVESARTLLAQNPDGVWMIELAPLTRPPELSAAILTTLGLRDQSLIPRPLPQTRASSAETLSGPVNHPTSEPGDVAARTGTDTVQGTTDQIDRLVAALADKRLLLVLDNCEHLIDHVASVADHLLGRCPELRILATSREPLNITGEVVWPVEPLDLPPSDALVQEAARHAAVRLFTDRASAAHRGFELDDRNVVAVTDICRALDGMPLAIELAAARLRTMTLDQIADRLDDRFQLLASGSRVALPRHQTLRAVVDWSWSLLADDERTLLRRLAYFSGGATPAAAEHIMSFDNVGSRPAADVLASLTDKSLLVLERGPHPRYRLLETIKAFGMDRLVEGGEVVAVRRAHGRYFMDLAESAEPHLRAADQLEWLAALDADRENLNVAVRAAIGAGDADTAVRLVAALGSYWNLRANGWEGLSLARQALSLPGDVSLEHRALAYTTSGLCAVWGPFEDAEAEAWLATAVELADQVERPEHPMLRLARPLAGVIEAWTRGTGTWHVPDDLVNDADPWTRGYALIMRAYSYIAAGGNHNESIRDINEAIDALRTSGDRSAIAMALTAAAELDSARGEFETAIARMEEALTLVTEIGSIEEMTRHRVFLARQLWLAGHRDRSMAVLDVAGHDADRIGLREAQVAVGVARADLYRFDGDAAAGHDALAQAEGIAKSLRQDADIHSQLMTARGYVATSQGALDDAAGYHRSAVDIAATSGDAIVLARAVVGAADVALARGAARDAARLIGMADEVRGVTDLSARDAARVEAGAREQLGDEGYTACYALGRGESSRERVCELARITLDA